MSNAPIYVRLVCAPMQTIYSSEDGEHCRHCGLPAREHFSMSVDVDAAGRPGVRFRDEAAEEEEPTMKAPVAESWRIVALNELTDPESPDAGMLVVDLETVDAMRMRTLLLPAGALQLGQEVRIYPSQDTRDF